MLPEHAEPRTHQIVFGVINLALLTKQYKIDWGPYEKIIKQTLHGEHILQLGMQKNK